MGSLRPRRLTIGFLVDSIHESYQSTVLAGVVDAAKAADVCVLCFCGGVLEAGDISAPQRNAIYKLIDSHTVDGLVVMSGAIGNVVGAAEMAAFCAAYRPLPIVSIAAALDGVPSVVVEDDTGMRDVVAHLIDVHARRHVAFIRGPQANEEAERRYRVYREVLAARDVPFRPERVVRGTFERASGAKSVGVLVDDRKVRFDAIVAASDEMAIGAVRELLARGIRVPEEVAVVGFDDVEAAQFCFPPLTTVRQPLYEQGRIATEMLLGELRGEPTHERMLLHTRLVTRRSCGCGPDNAANTTIEPEGGDLRTLSHEKGAAVNAAVLAALGASASSADATRCGRVVSAFVGELSGNSGQSFLRVLEDALRVHLVGGEPIGSWQDALSALRRATLGWMNHPDLRNRAEDLIHAGRALAGRYAELAQADRRTKAESFARVLNETSGALATSFDRTTLEANLTEHLPRLGIDHMYLSVYRNPDVDSISSRLLFAFDPEGTGLPAKTRFPSKWLVPEGTLPKRRSDFVVQPLFFDSERLGIVLLELGAVTGRLYETLRDQISAALKGSDLVQRVVEHDRQRQRLLKYILDVTPDMQRVQPLADLYQKILSHALGMLESPRDSSSDHEPSTIPPPRRAGLLASVDGSTMIVRASTEDGAVLLPIEECLNEQQLARVHAALEHCAVEVGEHSAVIPLRAGEATLAVVHLDCAGATLPDAELLSTLANQASAAIRSMQLYEMAALDPLTGAHTRRFLDDWLLREVKAASRSSTPLSLLMIDMDGMKQINDTGGHLAGDRALATVGKALRESTRPTDLVGRFGGDEFVVLLPRTGTRAADRVAHRVIRALSERDGKPALRISIGACTLPAAAESGNGPPSQSPEFYQRAMETLLRRADDALYRAKKKGGMRVCSSPPEPLPPDM
jgi:diguanylate cyclase (GGDEF)-like protein